MSKRNILAAAMVIGLTPLAGHAAWSEALDEGGIPWVEPDAFTGSGLPHTNGDGYGLTGSTHFQANTLFGAPAGTSPGFMVATGNAGASFFRSQSVPLTKAGGWTFMMRVAAHPGIADQGVSPTHLELLRMEDNTNQIAFYLDVNAGAGNSTATINDRWNNVPLASANLTLGSTEGATAVFHDYRLVRQPGSASIELYIDENPTPAASISPGAAGGGGINQEFPKVADSLFESAYDFWGYHAGATVPPIPEPSSLALLSLGGVALLGRKRR